MFILVEPLELKSESLRGPYPGPENKYPIQQSNFLSLSTAVGPVPREATPPQGVA